MIIIYRYLNEFTTSSKSRLIHLTSVSEKQNYEVADASVSFAVMLPNCNRNTENVLKTFLPLFITSSRKETGSDPLFNCSSFSLRAQLSPIVYSKVLFSNWCFFGGLRYQVFLIRKDCWHDRCRDHSSHSKYNRAQLWRKKKLNFSKTGST